MFFYTKLLLTSKGQIPLKMAKNMMLMLIFFMRGSMSSVFSYALVNFKIEVLLEIPGAEENICIFLLQPLAKKVQ